MPVRVFSTLHRRSVAAIVTVLSVIAVLAASACDTGHDAVQNSGDFQFVSPGGKSEIFYDPPSARKAIGNLHGPDLFTNRDRSIEDAKGKVVVINIWGQWCGPCRAEADPLERMYQRTKPLGVEFIGIDFRDVRNAAQDFVRDRNITYPSIFDPSGRSLLAIRNFPTSTTPSTIVLDRKHRVAAVFLRAVTTEDLQPVIERVAREKNS